MRGDNISTCEGITSVHAGGNISTVEDSISTVEGTFSTVGDNSSTCGGITAVHVGG